MTVWYPQAWNDYQSFHGLAVAAQDVDPGPPVLLALARAHGLSADQLTWAGMLYAAYRDLGSALEAWAYTGGTPAPADEYLLSLPCAEERASHRMPTRLTAHLAALHYHTTRHRGSITAWLRCAARTDPPHPGRLASTLAALPGNGRRAAHDTCALLAELLAPFWPAWQHATPTTMNHPATPGPRRGLALLTLTPPPYAAQHDTLDQLSGELLTRLHAAGLPTTPATAARTLADFAQLTAGRHYIGQHIDTQAQQLHRAELRPRAAAAGWLLPETWAARAAALPAPYLGERCRPPRLAPDKPRRRLYWRDGTIATREHRQ